MRGRYWACSGSAQDPRARPAERTLARARGIDINQLIGLAADRFEIEEALIRSSVKLRAAARAGAIVCFLAIDRLGLKGAEIARKMNLTPSGVSKLAGRGRKDPLPVEMQSRLFHGRST